MELLAGPGSSAGGPLRRMPWLSPAERARLQRRLAEPTLWGTFLALLSKEGHPVDTPEQRCAALRTLAHHQDRHPLAELADGLLDLDQGWTLWRARHVLTVQRHIGHRPGTAGTSGADHLTARAAQRLFPELWQSRLVVCAAMSAGHNFQPTQHF